MNERIYVVEDDENIRDIITLALTSNGYQVVPFTNAVDALKAFEQEELPDLAIFDVMMPELDGITAIKQLRDKNVGIPILIVSAKDSEIDKVRGLDSGSDDYITKPFGVLELSARVRSLLRRNQDTANMLYTKTLVIDKQKRIIKKDDVVLDLTNKEYQLLLFILNNYQRVVEREELLQAVWGYDFMGESRAIDVHIRALRSKLGDDGNTYIKTIRGVGYRYIEEGGVHE